MPARLVQYFRVLRAGGTLTICGLLLCGAVSSLAQSPMQRPRLAVHGSQAPSLRAEVRAIGVVRGPAGLPRKIGNANQSQRQPTKPAEPLTQLTFKRTEPKAAETELEPSESAIREPRKFVDYAVQTATFNSVDLGKHLRPSLDELKSEEPVELPAELHVPGVGATDKAEPRIALVDSIETKPALPETETTSIESEANKPSPIVAEHSAKTEGRRLAPRSSSIAKPDSNRTSPLADLSWAELSGDSVWTTAAALAVVLGLFLLLAWVWKRAAPKSAKQLPGEVVSVIGRVPLANKQIAQLVKVGNKLLLVNITPDGAETLTEISDPEEVASILADCEQQSPTSASAAFKEVFDQLAKEPAYGFLGEEEQLIDRQQLAAAYANTPGGRTYG